MYNFDFQPELYDGQYTVYTCVALCLTGTHRDVYYTCVHPINVLQGTDHLTVTWKVEENILHHIDIREQGKPNQFSLGKSLWIGSDVRLVLCTFNVSYTA